MKGFKSRKKIISYQKVELERLQKNLRLLVKGNLDFDLNVSQCDNNTKDERDIFLSINKDLSQIKDSIADMTGDANMLAKAAIDGKLDTRADASKHRGDFGKIVDGVNKTLDAVIGPLNVAAEYVDRISKGDIPPKITDTYNGDFNEIKNNLNSCIDVMNGLLKETNALIKATQEGKLDTRGNAATYAGGWGELVGGVNKLIDAFVGPINVTAEYVDRISKGDIPPKITDTYNGDFNEIKNNLNSCIDVMNGLLKETSALIKATQDGKLDTRGNAAVFAGGWGELVGGVNAMIDAFVAPINVTSSYVDRISKGDIPPKITDTYNGDFNTIKNNLNNCIDIMNGLLKETDVLIRATQDGKLQTRGDAKAFAGGWGELVGGVNRLIDAFVDPINVTSRYVERISKGDIPNKITDNYNGDFNIIKNNLNTCIDAVNALVSDANMLSKAAVEGKLSTRADASKHGGDFAKIVEGVNNTLDAVIEPVKEASAVLQEMARGNLQISVKGNYKGDHAEIKDALNFTIATISGYIGEISNVLNEMANGNLNVNLNGDYLGDFIEIKNSLNLIIKSLNEVLGDINSASEQVASGSKQVADGSQQLSQNSTEQASSIEELTSSMTQIAAQTKQNAVNASQANELALTAKENAVEGNKQMQGMLKSMSDINEASSNISKIIKVIDEIAFQTNILALNAAVEAARAGQHGKGFAVVAEEVRNLAARSADAAKETTALIEGTIKKVDDGTKIANETAQALNRIVSGVTKSTDLVGDIAIASNEQATGIAQVNQGVNQVSMVTQTNSATAEQSAAASEELSSQADLLKSLISKFSLKKSGSSMSIDGIDPELLKMIENSLERKRSVPKSMLGGRKELVGSKPKISLIEKDFGKY